MSAPSASTTEATPSGQPKTVAEGVAQLLADGLVVGKVLESLLDDADANRKAQAEAATARATTASTLDRIERGLNDLATRPPPPTDQRIIGAIESLHSSIAERLAGETPHTPSSSRPKITASWPLLAAAVGGIVLGSVLSGFGGRATHAAGADTSQGWATRIWTDNQTALVRCANAALSSKSQQRCEITINP